MIAPAVDGTLNVLKACVEAKVKRVVYVSSAAALMMNPIWSKNQVLDETCWSDQEFCIQTEVLKAFMNPHFVFLFRKLILTPSGRIGIVCRRHKQRVKLSSLQNEPGLISSAFALP